jgi:hypothetical protein
MTNPDQTPRVWGSMWWQNSAGKWFELRTSVTPRYVEEENASLPKSSPRYLWLPVGEKPTPQSLKWAEYGPLTPERTRHDLTSSPQPRRRLMPALNG